MGWFRELELTKERKNNLLNRLFLRWIRETQVVEKLECLQIKLQLNKQLPYFPCILCLYLEQDN